MLCFSFNCNPILFTYILIGELSVTFLFIDTVIKIILNVDTEDESSIKTNLSIHLLFLQFFLYIFPCKFHTKIDKVIYLSLLFKSFFH